MSHALSRRELLTFGSLAALTAFLEPRVLLAEEAAQMPVLVCLFMRGAADGLSLVVPYQERAYYARRSSIAIARPGGGDDAALDLDGQFGLHPRLPALLPADPAKELA